MKRGAKQNLAKSTGLIMHAGSAAIFAGCDAVDKKLQELAQLLGADFVPDRALGRTLYDANCARCHGARGTGSDRGPPLLDSTYRPGHHGDVTFYMAARNGAHQHHWNYGDMPAIPGLSDEDVGHIFAYVREEQRRAGIR